MVLDAVTLKNLEIVESRGENSKRTLLGVIDRNGYRDGRAAAPFVAAATIVKTERNSNATFRRLAN